MKFEGIYTPAVTPFSDLGEVETEQFRKILERLVGAGVHGIIIGGSTGEYYAQTMEERLSLAALAGEVIKRRTALIVSTAAIRTEDSVQYAKHAREIGADAIMIASPPYALPTEQENARHALAIDRAAKLPVMLYNYPGRVGVQMGREYLSQVSRSKNFQAIKESSGDVNRIHMLVSEFPHLEISCGMDDQAIEFFAWGSRSWVCGGSNFLPQEHLALYKACALKKDFGKGRAIMSALLPLMAEFEGGGKFVQCIKYGCEIVGIPVGDVRPPLQPLNAREKQRLSAVVSKLKRTVARAVRG